MPRGRACEAKQPRPACPRRIMRFLEPCLLLLLHKRAAHGYELAEHIKPFGFDVRQSVDSSLVYRTLRALESGGMSPPIGTRLPLLARPGACTI